MWVIALKSSEHAASAFLRAELGTLVVSLKVYGVGFRV